MILKHYYFMKSLPRLVIIFIQQSFIGEAPPAEELDIYKTGLDLILITTQKRMKKGAVYTYEEYVHISYSVMK